MSVERMERMPPLGQDRFSTPHLVNVLGEIPPALTGVADAHKHTWIEAILGELLDYRVADGAAIIACQPGGCGRNGNRMAWLSRKSGKAGDWLHWFSSPALLLPLLRLRPVWEWKPTPKKVPRRSR
jgi:hypothetical protein